MKLVILALFLAGAAAWAQTPSSISVIIDGKTYSCGQGATPPEKLCQDSVKLAQDRFSHCIQAGQMQSYCFENYTLSTRPGYPCPSWEEYCRTQCMQIGNSQTHCLETCSK